MQLSRISFAVALLATACTAQAQTPARAATPAPGIGATPAVSSAKVYIVQLAGAPVATYDGSVRGLAATRPAAGTRLNSKTVSVKAYLSYLERQRNAVINRIGKVNVLHTYGTTYNGFAALLTEAQAAQLMTYADVVSVVESEKRTLDTTRTPDMLLESAPGGIWSQLDGVSRYVKGEDVIVAHLDTGFWPEDPSFGDKQNAAGKPVAYWQAGTQVYGPPPARWNGTCVTGDGFTAAMCNNKVLGARYYDADFLASGAVAAALEYKSPRDGDGDANGHGSHTASTSSGNSNVEIVNSAGVTTAIMSGIAPRARLAIYKVCWTATVAAQTGCYNADTLRAIDDAVADGVDVINFSVSGTLNDYVDPVETAYLNATAAGVFVVAAAGNSGPTANTVAHIGPWLTTAASGTVDRAAGGGDLTLGNAAVYSGFSLNFFGVTSGSLLLSSTIPAAGQSVASANTCLTNSLDATAAVGKIVVCDRQATNSAANRLTASAEVKRVGGIGMVLLNPDTATPVADAHTIPTVQLANTLRAAVQAYAATAGATGTIGLSYNRPGVNAPVISSFSSRGPGLANLNVMKPDLTAPGSSITAALRPTLTQAQHDNLILGTFTPGSSTGSLSGTSMATPHIAGGAAVLRQLYPTWTPAAIKSALLTSTTPVKLSSGAVDTNRWNTGAGHLFPNGAAIPSLVFDTAVSDYGRFICGQNLSPPSGIGSCATLGSIKPWNLNLPSLQAAGVVVSRTLTRTVKNVSPATRTFVASASLAGWDVQVTPASLTLAPGQSGSFDTRLTRTTATLGAWTFGNLSWSDGVVSITSPLNAQALSFAAPAQASDVRAAGKGSKIINVESSYTGSMSLATIGLVPAIVNNGNVTAPATQCFAFTVPANVAFARFQLFQADTQGASTDLDMDVFRSANCTGTNVGTSAGGTSDEVVTLESPTAASYSVRVTGYATPASGAAYKLSAWVVGPAAGAQSLKATGPSSVYAGGSSSVALSWNVTPGARYMGLVNFFDGTAANIGTTKVLVDNR
jgi:subtilisin family serine protease